MSGSQAYQLHFQTSQISTTDIQAVLPANFSDTITKTNCTVLMDDGSQDRPISDGVFCCEYVQLVFNVHACTCTTNLFLGVEFTDVGASNGDAKSTSSQHSTNFV